MPSSTKMSIFTLGIGFLSFLRMGPFLDLSLECGMFHIPFQPTLFSPLTPYLIIQRLDGAAYTDVLHTYGMSRAGYIPQMFSFRLPNPLVIFGLLEKTGARALVWDPSSGVDLSGCPLPTYSATRVSEQDAADVILPPLRTDHSASELVFILQTSGSSSGSPKLIPCNRRWLDNIVTKSRQLNQIPPARGQDVTVAM